MLATFLQYSFLNNPLVTSLRIGAILESSDVTIRAVYYGEISHDSEASYF